MRRVLGFGNPNNLVTGDAGTEEDWGHPTYYPAAGDPEFTVDCVEDWGVLDPGSQDPDPGRGPACRRRRRPHDRCRSGVGVGVRLLAGAHQAARRRAHAISWGGRTRIDDDGLGSDATASRFGNLAGIVRAQELEAGQINYALFMVINCDSGKHVYPAQKGGRPCTDIGQSNENAPPMGARFQLAMSDAQIDALPVPAYKKTLLRAMAHYGLYFGDTGGGSWGIQFESGSTYSSFGQRTRFSDSPRRRTSRCGRAVMCST